ncbi:MAG TPA: anti-sigma factor [Acidimicrobiales bacterium]|nr:anti-sigma factor [Acidimicrobiales bacterium]
MSDVPPRRDRAAESDTGHLGDRLSSLVDGELAPAEMAAAQRHLEHCELCADELDDVERTRQLLRHLDAPKPPEGFVAGLVRRHRRLTLFVAALSVIAGIAAALVFTLSSPREDVTPPVNRFERIHATSTPSPDPITEMAPVGVSTTPGH